MKKTLWTIASAILVICVTVGLYMWPGGEAESNTDLRRTAKVRLGTLNETVMATGVIRPVTGAEINVGSRISGTVVSLPVAVGDRVEIGQLLAELDGKEGKDPVGLAAASLYYCCCLKGWDYTQRTIAMAAGITEVTIRNRIKDMLKQLKTKENSEFVQ